MCLLCQDNGMKQRPGVENLEECLYFIFIGGQHLNASWSHDGRCLLNAICVCVSQTPLGCFARARLHPCAVCVYVTYRICQVEGFGSKNQCCRLLWPLLLRIGFNKRYAGTSLRVAAGAIKREKAGFFFFPISAVCLAQLRMRRSFLTQIIWMPRWHRTIKKTGCI